MYYRFADLDPIETPTAAKTITKSYKNQPLFQALPSSILAASNYSMRLELSRAGIGVENDDPENDLASHLKIHSRTQMLERALTLDGRYVRNGDNEPVNEERLLFELLSPRPLGIEGESPRSLRDQMASLLINFTGSTLQNLNIFPEPLGLVVVKSRMDQLHAVQYMIR
jgi:hypothetical protein